MHAYADLLLGSIHKYEMTRYESDHRLWPSVYIVVLPDMRVLLVKY